MNTYVTQEHFDRAFPDDCAQREQLAASRSDYWRVTTVNSPGGTTMTRNQDQARRWAEEVELPEPAYPDCYVAPRTGGATRDGYSYEQVREAIAAALVKLTQQEPFYGHQFKKVQRGIWRCECGKQIIEGESKCTNGTRTISPSPQPAESQADTLTLVAGLAEQSARDSSTPAGNFRNSLPAPSRQEDRKPLTDFLDLAKVYATSYASPHHITFSVEGLRNLVEAANKDQK